MNFLKIKNIFPFILCFVIIFAYFIFLRIYLNNLSNEFLESFRLQNQVELSRGDIFELSTRINSLTKKSYFKCIVGTKNNGVFYSKNLQNCKKSFFKNILTITGNTSDNLSITFVLQPPPEVLWTATSFLLIQIALLFFLFSAIRSKEKEKFKGKVKQAEIAQQVSHDIRSPLAALRVCAKEVRELPEEHRLLIRSAVQRIEDIANDLSGKKAESEGKDFSVGAIHELPCTPGSPAEDLELHLLSSLVEPLISEKRLQHRSKLGIEIQSDLDEGSYGLFARVNVKEFKRVLSNLINNAVEVFKEENGIITVGLSPQDDFSKIQIADNGKGIPPDILSKLAQRGNTFGKEGGSGLGLFHARTTVEKWGGEFRIESKFVGAKPGFRPDLKRGDYMESPLRNGQSQGSAPTASGTTITLLLPKQESPDWFVPKIHLEENMTLVIVDDDQSIHQIWKERLKSYDKEKRIFLTHLSNPEQLRDWHELAGDKDLNILCLCDYEFLGCKQNGLDIIEELGIAKQSVLVTSRYEEKDVRERCARLKIKLLPKPLAGFVPVELPSLHSNGHYDCVLIDDEEMVHVPWQIAAQGHGKRLKTYKGPEDFLREVEQFSKDTPIYIDSLLANNRKGEEVSKQFSELGFTNIFLATGKKPKDFPNLPWIKKIVGKDPPW